MAEIMTPFTTDSVLSINITNNSTVTKGSGVLLSSGLYVLTVAHLFDNYIVGESIDIVSGAGTILHDAQVFVHHGWDPTDIDINHDIAIIKLSRAQANPGLYLWTEDVYQGQTFTLTGFGNDGALHTGTNVFDGDGALFNALFNKEIIENTQVIYDYDNGLEHQNTSKNLFNLDSTTMPTSNESIAKIGDSGGALLINNEIAAISSYIYSNALYDVNDITDSSFGEIGVATLVNPYIPWIEYITEGNIIYSTPESANQVYTTISEPFGGSVINYFLLEVSSIYQQKIILQYTTRDGTATAGLDYRHSQGSIELLPYEQNVTIGVTIYGDTIAERDETFSLVITDNTNEWLGIDVELIATHTIDNNDIFMV
tara:strand:- start:426 stop:1535 length:1110 start_codon:yes stop_codon:yes gene_type:complete